MKTWFDQDLFKPWRDAQQQMWANLEPLITSWTPRTDAMNWPPSDLRHLTQWGETAVKQALELQSSWLEQWSERVKREGQTPEAMEALVEQVREMLQSSIESQQALWDHWFRMLEENGVLQNLPRELSKQLGEWESRLTELFSEEWKSLAKWSEGPWARDLSAENLEKFTEQMKSSVDAWAETQAKAWDYWLGLFSGPEGQVRSTAGRTSPAAGDDPGD